MEAALTADEGGQQPVGQQQQQRDAGQRAGAQAVERQAGDQDIAVAPLPGQQEIQGVKQREKQEQESWRGKDHRCRSSSLLL
jgi:hypothetical protein